LFRPSARCCSPRCCWESLPVPKPWSRAGAARRFSSLIGTSANISGRGAVYGDVTSWVFRLGPVVNLAAVMVALLITPFGGVGSAVSFSGDVILLAGLLALGRFAIVLSALDTGSSFEGMGASREVHFAALAEPAFFLALATLARVTGSFSLTPIYQGLSATIWLGALPALALVTITLLVLALVENTRIPIDDPTTHLEITMIHEVMVLDHSGPDLAYIHYGAALKLWILGLLLVGLAVPVRSGNIWLDGAAMLLGMALLAGVIGMIESAMARYRLNHVPQFIVGAATLSAVAFILILT
jgi:formate hydrogenlyase subunit 4